MERELLVHLFEIFLYSPAIDLPFHSLASFPTNLIFSLPVIGDYYLRSRYKDNRSANDRSDRVSIKYDTLPSRHSRAVYRVWLITKIRALLSILSVALTLPILSRVSSLRGYLRGRELTLAGTRQSPR